MKSGIVVALVVVVLACAGFSWAISPVQYLIQAELEHSIGDNPFVNVGQVYGEVGDYRIDVVCSTADTGQGLAFLLIQEYEFGETKVTVTVLDEEGNPIEVDGSWWGEPLEDTQALLLDALQYNRLFVASVPGGSAMSDIAVMFKAEAIQYYSDDWLTT